MAKRKTNQFNLYSYLICSRGSRVIVSLIISGILLLISLGMLVSINSANLQIPTPQTNFSSPSMLDAKNEIDSVHNITNMSSIFQSVTTLEDPSRFELEWSSVEEDTTFDLAPGDFDGDGYLDLAVGNDGQPNRLYCNTQNDDGRRTLTLCWSSALTEATHSIAWGDYDNDGYLDLAVGNDGQPNRLYCNTQNDDGRRTLTLCWSSALTEDTHSIAWGDYDNDGDFDLAVGNRNYFRSSKIYANSGGELTKTPVWSATLERDIGVVAWGDYDNDADIDLAVGNHLYRNVNDELTDTVVLSLPELEYGPLYPESLDWGDYDSDGDLDLVMGAGAYSPLGLFNWLYLNNDGELTTTPVWSSPLELDSTASIAWGDYDNDGDLDLAVGNGISTFGGVTKHPNRLYRNDQGVLTRNSVWSSSEEDFTSSVAWGDFDNDGDLDMVVGNVNQPNRLYRNNSVLLTNNPTWSLSTSQNIRGDLVEFPYLISSVAWGDYDSDGDLDLAIGSSSPDWFNSLYENMGGVFEPAWSSKPNQEDRTWSVAWGDYDCDGDLDLAFGNEDRPNRLYKNENKELTQTPVWSAALTETTRSIAWGDYDNDGDLDLAVGNDGQPNRLYNNENNCIRTGNPIFTLAWSSALTEATQSIAWGDYDNDGDLDLAVGNDGQPNRLYQNNGGELAATPIWSSSITYDTTSVAWGDYDGDGDLDLAVGNGINTPSGPNRIFRNDHSVLTDKPIWSSSEAELTTDIAWGDYDGDGDLDLAAGNGRALNFQLSRLYRNENSLLKDIADWTPNKNTQNASVAWGDYDSDGDLDLIIGSESQPMIRLYQNMRDARFGQSPIPVVRVTRPGAANSADFYSVARVWTGPDITLTYTLFHPHNLSVRRIIGMYSINGGGSWSQAVATTDTVTENLNTSSYFTQSYSIANATRVISDGINGITSTLMLTPTDAIADIDVYLDVTHNRFSDLTITLASPFNRLVRLDNQSDSYREVSGTIIFDDEALKETNSSSTHIRPKQALSRFDGYPLKGTWTLSVTDEIPGEGGLFRSWGVTVTLNSGAVHTYTWDVFKNGIMGQSDNVVFRLIAIPAVNNPSNQVPGPYIYGAHSASTFPFRIRGNQVRVIDEGGQPRSNALVYRLPATRTDRFEPYSNAAHQNFRTDTQGYLQGRGTVVGRDQLVALLPITWTHRYTLYHTSAKPITSGLDAHLVEMLGVQVLTVSHNNPLILFNLNVSLEWDASKDEVFLRGLERNLRRASEILYDLSNGGIALGKVQVYQAKERWEDADVIVFANNNTRPNADVGGFLELSDLITETVKINDRFKVITNAYAPGQVRIGPIWSRFGSTNGNLGEDWARVLAHELSHYLLFLLDNYLGVVGDTVVPIDCQGSFMSNPYRDDYSEFLTESEWALPIRGPNSIEQRNPCLQTLAQEITQRSDWETITKFYPALEPLKPLASVNAPGPRTLPLQVTQIKFIPPSPQADLMPTPFFNLKTSSGDALFPFNGQAQGYLIKTHNRDDPTDDSIIALGSSNQDLIHARGAALGDEICVFDYSHYPLRLGCEVIASRFDSTLTLHKVTNWPPQITVTPETSRTFVITVMTSSAFSDTNSTFYTQILPKDQEELKVGRSPTGTLERVRGGTRENISYRKTIELEEPTMNGFVRVWVDDRDAITQTITEFALQGEWPGPCRRRRCNKPWWAWWAPVFSEDGSLAVFDKAQLLGGATSYVQTLAQPPELDPWLIPVGQAYRISTVDPLTQASVLFSYLERDVPLDQENWLEIYAYDPDKEPGWQRLDTQRDTTQNIAAAKMPPSVEVYALMSTMPIPSFRQGWNNFGYTVPVTQPILTALASISGSYRSVYHYDAASDNWFYYDPTVKPEFDSRVNDLVELEFGHGYWVYTTEPATLYLAAIGNEQSTQNSVRADSVSTATPMQNMNFASPPAIFYGWITLTTLSIADIENAAVSAWMNGQECASTPVFPLEGQWAYVLSVKSAGSSNTPQGCGLLNEKIEFKINSTTLDHDQEWENSQAHFNPLNRVEH